MSSYVNGTSELSENKFFGYGLSDTLGTQYSSLDGMITRFDKSSSGSRPCRIAAADCKGQFPLAVSLLAEPKWPMETKPVL
jgi:hypothetical protein